MIFMARMRQWAEFAPIWMLVKAIGLVPRSLARSIGGALGTVAYLALGRLRKVGQANLAMAFPGMGSEQQEKILRAMYRGLGWQLAEFCHMPRLTLVRANRFIRYEGLNNFLSARARGKGVLILTGHIGAWELSSFYHSLAGYPMSMVIRRLDNSLLDRYVNHIRCLHGNRVLHKDDFARGLIAAMRTGETVGVLMDTNMTPPQGVFADFFGTPACTAAGVARVALKTGAAVVPGFMVWHPQEKKYVLHFLPALDLIRTGDDEAGAHANTQIFNRSLEAIIRQYPEQWLWVHRRWKTRPAGEAPLYR
jgi:KDO2-lipid IV(A) lauroyltransferase